MVAHEIAGLLYLTGLSIFYWPTYSPIFFIIFYAGHSSTLKMEAAGPLKTLVPNYQTVCRYIPEDSNLHKI
jgi:hypothetical protein